MARLSRVTLLALCAMASSCGSDGGAGVVTVTVSGSVLDYFTGMGVADVTVAVERAPSLNGNTSSGGAYSISNVPATESLVLIATKSNHRLTRNFQVSAASGTVTADLAIVAAADVQRQYASVGITATTGLAVVFVELVDGSGAPRTGIPAAGIVLVDGTQSPVGDGPFFFGAAGDIVTSATLSQSTEFGGRARAAFLNVPQGTHTLRVTVGSQTIVAAVVAVAGGATLVER